MNPSFPIADRSDSPGRPIDTHLSSSGIVTEAERDRAVEAISAAISDIDRPIARCVIRLEHGADPHHVRHAVVRFSVDLDGASVHAHADAESVGQATTLAAERLHEQLRRRLDRAADARRHGRSLADFEAEIAGGTAPAAVPTIERDADERELVERAVFGPATSTVDEAAFDLDALGYDFHLFVETTTGVAALIRRSHDGVTVQWASGPNGGALDVASDAIAFDGHPAPRLDLVDARGLLHLGHSQYVFFVDAATERATVVYRRYDGHDGVITVAG